VLQTLSRMSVLYELKDRGYTIKPLKPDQLTRKVNPKDFLIPPQENTEEQYLIEPEDLLPYIDNKRYDFCEIVITLFGYRIGVLFTVIIFLGFYGTLIGLATVFASSAIKYLPIYHDTCNIYDDSDFGGDCRAKYWIFLAFFAAVTTSLTVLGLVKQAVLQIVMCSVRLIAYITILVTSWYAIFSDTKLDDTGANEAAPETMDFYYIGLCFPIVLMSTYFHSAIPTCIQYVKDKRETAPKICFLSLSIVSLLFLCIGLIVPFAVENVEKMINLNWYDYSAGDNPSERPVWAYIIAGFIVICPAIDAMSIFPICAINLCDNLTSVFHSHFGERELTCRQLTFYRLICSLPPVIIAGIFYDLSYISAFKGIISILVSGIFIPLSAIATRKLVPNQGGYDTKFNDVKTAWGTLVFSVISVSAIFILIIIYLSLGDL